MQLEKIENFTLKQGDAAVETGLVTPNQAMQAKWLQAKAILIARNNPNWNPKALEDIPVVVNPYDKDKLPVPPLQIKIERDFERSGFSYEQLEEVYRSIGDPALKLPSNIPYMNDLLKLTGALLPEHSHPMLAAQGAALTIKAIKDSTLVNADVQAVLADQRRLKFDPDEPDYVRSAQSLYYLTSIMVAAVKQYPELLTPEVEKAFTSAEMLASQSMKRAAEAMERTPGQGPNVAKQMGEIRSELRGEVDVLSRTFATSVHVKHLKQGLYAIAAKLPEQEKDLLLKEIETQTQKVNALQVTGSLLDPPLPSSWLTKTRPQMQGQGRNNSFHR